MLALQEFWVGVMGHNGKRAEERVLNSQCPIIQAVPFLQGASSESLALDGCSGSRLATADVRGDRADQDWAAHL